MRLVGESGAIMPRFPRRCQAIGSVRRRRTRPEEVSLSSTSALGIELLDAGLPGVTANDSGDGDSGTNELQNFPLVTSASIDESDTTVAGALNSHSGQDFTLEFFANTACDASGHGEPSRTYITTAPLYRRRTAREHARNSRKTLGATLPLLTTEVGWESGSRLPDPVRLGRSPGIGESRVYSG